MIFVTTGHQTPFDRLVRLVDEWNGEQSEVECFAQIGAGQFIPRVMKWQRWLTPEEFDQRVRQASLIVGHAGTGTIIQTMEAGKPLLVLARRSSLGETRNDHQVATVQKLAGYSAIHGAVEEREFIELLRNHSRLVGTTKVGQFASAQLLDRLNDFFWGTNQLGNYVP